MADYNVNMKQWNGSSFDNVLPLAFNSKALEGKSYDDIIQYVQSAVGMGGENCRVVCGSYIGTGTYGTKNANRIDCDFCPIMMLVGDSASSLVRALRGINKMYWGSNRNNTVVWGDASVSWYYQTTDTSYDRPTVQLNKSGTTYYYLVLGYSN